MQLYAGTCLVEMDPSSFVSVLWQLTQTGTQKPWTCCCGGCVVSPRRHTVQIHPSHVKQPRGRATGPSGTKSGQWNTTQMHRYVSDRGPKHVRAAGAGPCQRSSRNQTWLVPSTPSSKPPGRHDDCSVNVWSTWASRAGEQRVWKPVFALNKQQMLLTPPGTLSLSANTQRLFDSR